MMENNKNSNIVDAHAEIMHIRDAIMRMGATDNSEKERIENILQRLRDKQIEPNKALEEARAVLNSKQDYH